jgi:hypothetical protein
VWNDSKTVLIGLKCEQCKTVIDEGLDVEICHWNEREFNRRAKILEAYAKIMSTPNYKLPDGYSLP